MPQIRDRALVLRRRRMMEADAMLTLLGETHGKLSAKAPSLSKSANKLAGTLQTFNLVDVVLYAKRQDQEIWTVTQAGLVRCHAVLQAEMVRLAFAGCAAELVDALTVDAEPAPDLFRLLAAALEHWDRHAPCRLELAAFHLRILTIAGYAPSFEAHPIGADQTGSEALFSPREGCLVAPEHADGDAIPVPPTVLQVFRYLASGGKASKCSIGERDVLTMMRVLHAHLEYHSAWRPKAWRFLQEVVQ